MHPSNVYIRDKSGILKSIKDVDGVKKNSHFLCPIMKQF